MHSYLPLPKFMAADLHKYLDKYRQVSEQCRLSTTAPVDLQKRCDRPSRLVKAQLTFLKASADMVERIDLQVDALQWPGQPWNILCNISVPSMENEASKIARMQHKRKSALRRCQMNSWFNLFGPIRCLVTLKVEPPDNLDFYFCISF